MAPDGADCNPGTRANPLFSLEAARDAVRRLRDTAPGAVTVWLHGGVYRRETSFRLTKRDSGSQEALVSYKAFGDGAVNLSGAKTVRRSDFVPLTDPNLRARIVSKTAREQVLCLDLRPFGIGPHDGLRRHGFLLPLPLPPNELFIDGKPMRRSRWPKSGYLQTGPTLKDWIGRRLESRAFSLAKRGTLENLFGRLRSGNNFLFSGGAFHCDSDRLRFWQQAEDLWVDGVFTEDWAWSYNKVAALNARSGTVALADPETYALPKQGGGRFFFDNLLEEIADPGETYLDSKRCRLYLLPPDSFWADEAVIALSKLSEPLISMDDVSHVSFEGLTLECGRDAGIAIRGGYGNQVRDCEIRHFGRDALTLEGVQHRAVDCYIHHIGGTAVRLAGGNLKSLEPGGLVLTASHIHDWGRWQKVYAPAVELDGVGNQVSNCHIHQGPHMAVTISGNDHRVVSNEIDAVVLEFRDMGAIYINQGEEPLHRGSSIQGNYIHHLANPLGSIFGVYLDRGSMGLSIEGNFFHAIGSLACPNARAVGGNGFAHVTVRGNLFLDCTVPFELAFYLQNWGKRDVAPLKRAWRRRLGRGLLKGMPHAGRYPELQYFFSEDRYMPNSNRFAGNLIVNQRVPRIHKGTIRTLYGPTELVSQENNWIVPAEQRLAVVTLRSGCLEFDSVVFEKIPDFVTFDLAQVGHYKCRPVLE